MAYSAIPTRTSASTASSADINQLDDNIDAFLNGIAPYNQIATPATPASNKLALYFKSDNKLYKKTSAGTESEIGASVTLPAAVIPFPAGSLNIRGTTFPEFLITGTSRFGAHYDFDTTTVEPTYGQFVVPADCASTGTVTFRINIFRTAGSNTGTVWSFGYVTYANAGAYTDASDTYTDVDSGTCAITSTDTMYQFTWTADLATIGFTANKQVLFRLQRKVGAAGDDMTSDAKVTNFQVEIPR